MAMGYLNDQFEHIGEMMRKLMEGQEMILDRIEEWENKNNPTPEDSLLTSTEVCQQFKISPSTLRRWRIDGLKCRKVGKKLYFGKNDIEKWLKAR